MGDAADDLMFREMGLVFKERTYKCGYCKTKFGADKDACQKHADTCSEQKKGKTTP